MRALAPIGKQLWLGVTADCSPVQVQRLVMSNSALLANAVFACPSTAAVWWLGYHELAAAIALVPLTLGAGLVMSWRGYTMASRIWSAVVQVVICLQIQSIQSKLIKSNFMDK